LFIVRFHRRVRHREGVYHPDVIKTSGHQVVGYSASSGPPDQSGGTDDYKYTECHRCNHTEQHPAGALHMTHTSHPYSSHHNYSTATGLAVCTPDASTFRVSTSGEHFSRFNGVCVPAVDLCPALTDDRCDDESSKLSNTLNARRVELIKRKLVGVNSMRMVTMEGNSSRDITVATPCRCVMDKDGKVLFPYSQHKVSCCLDSNEKCEESSCEQAIL